MRRRRHANPSPLHVPKLPPASRAPIFTRGPRRLRLLAPPLAVALLAALGGGALWLRHDGVEPTTVAAGTRSDTVAAQEGSFSRKVEETVVLEEAGSQPRTVRVAGDGVVDLTIENHSGALHHVIVEPLDLHVDVDPGETESITVSRLPDGVFRSWCSTAGHDERTRFVVT